MNLSINFVSPTVVQRAIETKLPLAIDKPTADVGFLSSWT